MEEHPLEVAKQKAEGTVFEPVPLHSSVEQRWAFIYPQRQKITLAASLLRSGHEDTEKQQIHIGFVLNEKFSTGFNIHGEVYPKEEKYLTQFRSFNKILAHFKKGEAKAFPHFEIKFREIN